MTQSRDVSDLKGPVQLWLPAWLWMLTTTISRKGTSWKQGWAGTLVAWAYTCIQHTVQKYTACEHIHSSNGNIIYVATSGTNGQVYKSTDGGLNFSIIATGLPNIGKNTIVHQGRNTNNPIYVGTSLGVYHIDDTMTTWQPFGTNLPNVAVTDLEINLEDNKLIAATYGRGIWQSDIPIQLPASDLKFVEIQNPSSVNINCGTSITPQFQVENNGIDVINVVNVSYEINGVPNTFIWNGSILSGDTATVTLPVQNLSRGVYDLNITATTPNDAYSDNNSRLISFYIKITFLNH